MHVLSRVFVTSRLSSIFWGVGCTCIADKGYHMPRHDGAQGRMAIVANRVPPAFDTV